MAHRPRPAWIRYGGAILAIAVAALFRFQLDPLLKDAGFTVFFIAVVIAAWFGGLGPSLLALISSLVVSGMFFASPPDDHEFPALRIFVGLGTFFFVGVLTALLSQSMRAAQRRAELQAEDALRQREQLQTTLACIGDAVIVVDRSGRLTMMNMVAESLTGWTSGEAIGQPLESVFRILNEQTREAVESPVDRALNEGVIVGLANHTILISKDGTERPIDDSAAPIRDADGTVTGVVLIFRDVTKSRKAQLALREADRRKDEFLAILAHELRNPLAPICTALEILRTPAANSKAIQQAQEVMQRQVHHLVRLVDDLLDVSRIMRGKIELRPESIDLRTVVARAVETAQPIIDSQEHELIVSLPPEPVMLTVDPIRFGQIINNLLTNAAKYTEHGGHIWLTAEHVADQITIRVRDTGIGIPKEMLPQVFQLFTQVDSSVTRSQGGLGIGLTLVQNLVELNGGSVEAHSEGLGKGSEFVVRLPMPADGSASVLPQHHTTRPIPASSKHRILVVDDNADAADSLTMLLKFGGHQVDVAHDGLTALDKAKLQTPEVVFLDVGMPRMDGLEVARRMRQLPETETAVLVALTGWGSDEDRRRTREAGFDFHMVKPVTHEAVDQLLAEVDGNLQPMSADLNRDP
jgi:PAS domain S-box-containing protein